MGVDFNATKPDHGYSANSHSAMNANSYWGTNLQRMASHRGGFNSHSPDAAVGALDDDGFNDGGFADTLQRRLADGSGFESAFDDEFEPTRYCVNCTSALDGDLCMVRPVVLRLNKLHQAKYKTTTAEQDAPLCQLHGRSGRDHALCGSLALRNHKTSETRRSRSCSTEQVDGLSMQH